MGGKKTMEDSRRFEKVRRDKLNIAFDELSKLLPEHDPSVTLSKIEILRRAAEYIKLLQQQNEEIIKMGSDSALKDESEKLKKRVAQLLLKTKELVDILRNAGVTIPINKKNKKKKPANQNQLVVPPKQSGAFLGKDESKVKCCCMKEKRPLKEVNTTSTQITEQAPVLTDSTNIISVTPLNALPIPVPSSTASDTSGELSPLNPTVSDSSIISAQLTTTSIKPPVVHPCIFQNAKFFAINNVTSCTLNSSLQTPSIKDKGIQISEVSPSNLNGVNCSVVTTNSSQVLTTQTIVNTTTSTIQTDSITSNQAVGQNINNLPVLENNVIPNFGTGTLILADGRIVVPQIVPQILVKPPQTVILLPATTKKEKLLMPKKREVTKTTYANKAPIPAIPPFRLEPYPNIRPKNKVKSVIKRPEKGMKVDSQCEDFSKRRKLEIKSNPETKTTKESTNEAIGGISEDTEKRKNKQEKKSCGINEDNLISSPASGESVICENAVITTLNTKQITCSADPHVGEVEPDLSEQPSSINIELLNETAESSLSNIQLHDIGISDEVEKNSSLPHFIVSDKTNSICSDVNVQMVSSCTSELIQKELNEHITEPLISLNEKKSNDKVEPAEKVSTSLKPPTLNSNNKVNNDKIENSSITIANCSKSDLPISNIPPCISSIAIHDSLFKTRTQALSLNENSTLSFSSEILSNAASFTPDISGKIIEESNCESNEKSSLVENNNQPSSDVPEVSCSTMDASKITPELTKSLIVTSSNGDSANPNSPEVVANADVLPHKTSISEENLEKGNSSQLSSELDPCAPGGTEGNTRNLEKENIGTKRLTNDNIPGEHSQRCIQQSNCLSELSLPKTFNNDSFSQPSTSDLHEQCKGPAVSTSSSQLSSLRTLITTGVSNPAYIQNSSNNPDFKICNYPCSEKNTSSDLLSFINPINTTLSVSSSIYSGYPSTSYYSNESQTYAPGAFSQKHVNTSTQSLSEKTDLFSNINTPLSTGIGEKNLYSKDFTISQSSPLKSSELDKEPYNKTQVNVCNAWDNPAKEKTTFQNNRSKSSAKDNECSENGYLGFQNEPISTSNSNLFTSFASSIPVTCGFMDSSSVFSYQSSCPSVISSSYITTTTSELQTRPEQTYISNILTSASIPSSLMNTEKLSVGYYSTNSHCNDISVSLPSSISMYSSYVPNSAYGNSSLQSTPRGYTFSSSNGTLQNNTFTSSQTPSLFNYSNSTQTNITSLFSNPPDLYTVSKSITTASATCAIPTRTTCSAVFSISNNENSSNFQSSSNFYSSQTKTGVYPTNYNHLRLSTHGAPLVSSSTAQANTSSAYSSSSLTNNTSQINSSDVFTPGSLQPEISNLFNAFPLSTSYTSSSQSQANISAVYSLSKSSVSSQASITGVSGASFAPDNSNYFNSMPLPNISNVQINLSQSLATNYLTSSGSNKSPIFTQASSSGMYVSSMQLDGANSTVSSLGKPSTQSKSSNLPKDNELMWNASSIPSSSVNATQSNTSARIFSQTTMGGTFTSFQPNASNVITNMSSSNVQSKLTSLSNVSNSLKNNMAAKSIQTGHNELYFSGYQSSTTNILSDLSMHDCNQSTSQPPGSGVHTSSSSINRINDLVQTKDSRSYSRPEVEPTNIFLNVSLSAKSGIQPPFLQGNAHNSSSLLPQTEGLSDANKYQGQTSSSLYDQQKNNSQSNTSKNSCLPESTLPNKTGNDECQLLNNPKEAGFIPSLNSNICDAQVLNVNKDKGFTSNQQSGNKIDSNNLGDKQRNLTETECAYLNDKNSLSNNYSSPLSKDSGDSGPRSSYSNNLHETASVQVDPKSSTTQPVINNSNDSEISAYKLSNKGTSTQNGSSTPEIEANDNSEKTIQSNAKSYNVTSVNNMASSNSESNEQMSINHKSVTAKMIGTSYNYNVRNSAGFNKSFQSQNPVPSSLPNSSFQGNCYSNYNASSYNQYNNGALILANRETSVCTALNSSGSGQPYGNVNKETPTNITSESTVDKQIKNLQKPYSSGNALKGDTHLDLLKTKDIEKNTFIPIGYEDMRLPSDFSSDLFSSLQVPTGGQHSESISPTAAFLLAFPLVSTSKNVENLNEAENHENHTPTPTTILQIGNIDPPTTELFHPIDFQKSTTKTTDQFDLNSDYLQLPELTDKQNPSYKRCDKRKDAFVDFGKDIRTSKQKLKVSVPTTSTYSQSFSNPLMSCNDYQFSDKEGSQWQQEYTQNVTKDPKKVCDRKRDKINQKVCYHQNYQDCYNYKDKKRKQQNRISVNWMSTPENREQTDYQQKEIDGIMAPPAQTIYSGISLDFASETFSDLTSVKKVNNYSWSPSKALLPSLDNHLMIPSTLPTLVGDLALGTSTPSESYKTFETPKLLSQGPMAKKALDKPDETKKRNDFPKTQANFFSVSQLVDPKSKKQKTIERNYRRPEKNSKGRNTFNCPKRKDDHCMFYEDKNNFVSSVNQFPEKRNHYKGGSYSAESLIGAQSQELDFAPFNYQQNSNYFQNDFSLNPDGSNQQYGYLQQNSIGGFNQEDCQEFGFGTSQRTTDNIRMKSTRKDNSYAREGAGVLPHPTSYPPYTKSINYNLAPPSNQVHSLNTNTTNTLTNFNLSTIFPEMNDQRAATTGQPQQSVNHSFSNTQNYSGHLT